MAAELILPWPPSTNRMWRHVAIGGCPRVLLSAEGRAYRLAVQRAVGPCRRLDGRLVVTVAEIA